MSKYNIIRYFVAAAVVLLPVGVLSAQPSVSATDSLTAGKLFSLPNKYSTSAVSSITGDQLGRTPDQSLMNGAVGLATGLNVNQRFGAMYYDTPQWMIRGAGSYGFGGNNTAKIYVDGFEVDDVYMLTMSPAEIESMTILKDGAALATLGERGSNGVIWIETKRGKIGPGTLSVRLRYGVQTPSNISKPVNSYDYANMYNQAISNDKGAWSPSYSQNQLDAYKNGTGVNVDWYDQVLKSNNSYVDGDVIFNGGNKTARYNVVLGYVNQGGLLNVANNKNRTSNLDYSKYNVRANLDFDLFGIVEARVDLGGRIQDFKKPNYDINTLMRDLEAYPSNVYNVFDDAAQTRYSGTGRHSNNPVASISELGFNHQHYRTLQGNFSLKERLDMVLPGLYLKEAFSFSIHSMSTRNKTKDYTRYSNGERSTTNQESNIVAGGYGSGGMIDWKQGAFTIGWDRTYGKHSITSAANLHISAYKGDGYFSFKNNYMNYSARVNYAYDNRYVAEVAFSSYGGDAFDEDNRWSFYPSVSGAWIISNESFLKKSETVDFLKLRASFGMTGNSESTATSVLSYFDSNGRFLSKDYYRFSEWGSFYMGSGAGSWQGNLTPMFIANKDAHAEKSYKFNVGVETKLLGSIDISADIYLDKRTDILTLDESRMGYYGRNYFFSNIGEMTNKGFEVMATYSQNRGDFKYNLTGMVSFNTNKINEMGEVPTAYSYNARTGRPFGTYIGLESAGFFSENDFTANGSLKDGIAVPAFGPVQPGDLKYNDLNGDDIIDDKDMTKVGNSYLPKWTYSLSAYFNYKGFDLNLLLQGVGGVSSNLLDNPNKFLAFADNGNAYDIAKGAWAYYPAQGIDNRANATYPRLSTEHNYNNYQTSSFWVKSGNYLKVRNMELGYNFDGSALTKAGIANLRVYAMAMNPFTFSKLTKDYDVDPERLTTGYPMIRSYNLGVAITF